MKLVLIAVPTLLFLFLGTLYWIGSYGMHAEGEIVIESQTGLVWDYLVDGEKLKMWNPDIVSDEPLDQLGVQPGARSRMVLLEHGAESEYYTKLVEVDEGRLLTLDMTGANLGERPMHVSYQLVPVDRGTKVRFESTWQPSGFILKLMTPIIGWISAGNVESSLKKLKASVESDS